MRKSQDGRWRRLLHTALLEPRTSISPIGFELHATIGETNATRVGQKYQRAASSMAMRFRSSPARYAQQRKCPRRRWRADGPRRSWADVRDENAAAGWRCAVDFARVSMYDEPHAGAYLYSALIATRAPTYGRRQHGATHGAGIGHDDGHRRIKRIRNSRRRSHRHVGSARKEDEDRLIYIYTLLATLLHRCRGGISVPRAFDGPCIFNFSSAAPPILP